jgi:poly-beta-1,6-N-acetyl-D-glucosamine synthase
MNFTLLFWISFCIVLFTYAGYGLLMSIVLLMKKRKQEIQLPDAEQLPGLTVVVAAYNEAAFIRQKIQNTLSLVYPSAKINYLFVTDGSNDATPELVAQHANIQLLHQPLRAGKTAALNRAMQLVQTPIVVFSDANTLLNEDCLLQMAKHYANPKVGGVAGEKKINYNTQSTSVGIGEGLYWQYESSLKQLDADLNTVVGAAGELFSIRTNLYKQLPNDILLDDFVQTVNICEQGFKMAYEPMAYAIESPSTNLKEEFKRKVRIAAGDFQVLFGMPQLLNFFKHPLFSWQYFCRRVLRWLFCPLALLGMFVANAFLLKTGSFFQIIFMLQCSFYAMASIGGLMNKRGFRIIIFFLPYYFVFMNYCLVAGFFRYLFGRQQVIWEKAERVV